LHGDHVVFHAQLAGLDGFAQRLSNVRRRRDENYVAFSEAGPLRERDECLQSRVVACAHASDIDDQVSAVGSRTAEHACQLAHGPTFKISNEAKNAAFALSSSIESHGSSGPQRIRARLEATSHNELLVREAPRVARGAMLTDRGETGVEFALYSAQPALVGLGKSGVRSGSREQRRPFGSEVCEPTFEACSIER
jgi:hypothetical protein